MSKVMFFFDFDITLLPSTLYKAARKQNNTALPFQHPDETKAMTQLEEATISLFERCLNYGPVRIISNGSTQWQEMTLIAYMERLSPFLKRKRIPIISARDEVGRSFSIPYSNGMKWKTLVFEKALVNTFGDVSEAGLISIGDGKQELVAMRNLREKYPKASLSHIRFASNPDIATLLRRTQSVTELVANLVRGQSSGIFLTSSRPKL